MINARHPFFLIVMTSFALASAHPAAAAAAAADGDTFAEPCNLALSIQSNVQWRGARGRGYDVFDNTEVIESAEIVVRHQGGACNYVLTAAPQSGGSVPQLGGSRGNLNFDLTRDPRGQSFLSPDYFGTSVSQIPGMFDSGDNRQSVHVFATVPPSQIVPAGTYLGGATIRLFEVRGGALRFVQEAPLSITVPVVPTVQVSFSGMSPGIRRTSIDLGNLTDGVARSIGLSIRGNSDVSVELVSANHGKLAHEKGAPGIAYTAVINGTAVDLSAPAHTNLSWSGNQYQDFSLDIRVPAQPRETAAGRYSDVLTVTVTADG